MTVLVNDVRSRLNPTAVAEVARPRSVDELQAIVRRTSPIALCGGRHALGGQQFCRGGVVVDTTGLDRVLALDGDRGLVEVEAGIRWPALIDALAGTPWTIRQKQVGADDLSVGGSVAANAHGRALGLGPLVGDVERVTLVDAAGDARACSREEERDLFRIACGGYGLVGAIATVTLRLEPRARLGRLAQAIGAEELAGLFEAWTDDGGLHGEAVLAIDPAAEEFLVTGVIAGYWAVADEASPSAPVRRDKELAYGLAITDKTRAFELEASARLASSGDIVESEAVHLGARAEPCGWAGASETLGEVLVPRDALAHCLAAAAVELRARDADVVHASVRMVERDDETVFAWARERWACLTVHLHVEHDAVSVGRAADAYRALIDVALDHGGSYHVGYHRWARRDQVERAHPRIDEFLRAKHEQDPCGVFQTDWYRHLLALLDRREVA